MRAEQRIKRDAFLSRVGSQPLGSQPVVMGILNVTPDSFSDGGRFRSKEAAVSHAKALVAAGCDILDVGGESTRPGAEPILASEELARIEPVLVLLGQSQPVPLSVDTYKAAVARRGVEIGAILVNDVGGLQRDPAMADAVAAAEAAVVIMHSRSQKDAAVDIMVDIRRFFDRSLALAARAGIPEHRIILDPGIGFGKTARQNIDAIARLGELAGYRRPILIGVSRKMFLGSALGEGAEGTLSGTVAASLAAAAAGASIFRVHDVAEHVAALKVFHTIRAASRH
jgi:dihydropteroate synthase